MRSIDILMIYIKYTNNGSVYLSNYFPIILGQTNDLNMPEEVKHILRKNHGDKYTKGCITLDGKFMYDDSIEVEENEKVRKYGRLIGSSIIHLLFFATTRLNSSDTKDIILIDTSENYDYYILRDKLSSSMPYDSFIFPLHKNENIKSVISDIRFIITMGASMNKVSDNLTDNMSRMEKGNIMPLNEAINNIIYPYIQQDYVTYSKLDYRFISIPKYLPGIQKAPDHQKVIIHVMLHTEDELSDIRDIHIPSIGMLRSLKLSGLILITNLNSESMYIVIDTGQRFNMSDLTSDKLNGLLRQHSNMYDNHYYLYFIFEDLLGNDIKNLHNEIPMLPVTYTYSEHWYNNYGWEHKKGGINERNNINKETLKELISG